MFHIMVTAEAAEVTKKTVDWLLCLCSAVAWINARSLGSQMLSGLLNMAGYNLNHLLSFIHTCGWLKDELSSSYLGNTMEALGLKWVGWHTQVHITKSASFHLQNYKISYWNKIFPHQVFTALLAFSWLHNQTGA